MVHRIALRHMKITECGLRRFKAKDTPKNNFKTIVMHLQFEKKKERKICRKRIFLDKMFFTRFLKTIPLKITKYQLTFLQTYFLYNTKYERCLYLYMVAYRHEQRHRPHHVPEHSRGAFLFIYSQTTKKHFIKLFS